MVPAIFRQIGSLPLTPHGKVDRKALADIPADDSAERCDYVGATTPTEERLVRIWGEVLGIDGVGVHDNFFALGGDSLLSVQIVARIQEEWGYEIPLGVLFDRPTIADLAALMTTDASSMVPLRPLSRSV
jgi:acyl carrier protein